MSDIEIITFGCRLNAYESEVMRKHACDAGLGATVIVNTCAVTQESVRQARQAIRRARRENPQAKIVVTGCAAQVDPAPFAAMDEVDHIIGNQEKTESCDLPRARLRRHRAGQGQRHHVGEGDRWPSDRRLRRPGPCLCANSERLRSSLHLLHHSVRPRALALGACRRGGGAGAQAGRERLCRDRADRRRHHRLWRGPSRRDHPRGAHDQDSRARAGAQAAAGSPQSIRSRPMPRCSRPSPRRSG